jgi:hypothetical protein
MSVIRERKSNRKAEGHGILNLPSEMERGETVLRSKNRDVTFVYRGGHDSGTNEDTRSCRQSEVLITWIYKLLYSLI